MSDLIGLLLGPLAGPECRRALGRGWLVLVRCLAAVAFGAILVVAAWWWWANTSQFQNQGFSPASTLRVSLLVVVGLSVVSALLLTPALLAGSLAGDRDRQAMGMLLTTRVNGLEIVVGRMAGKYSQVAAILLAGLPTLLFLGGLSAWGPVALITAAAYPLCIAIGSAGVTAAASSVSKRGRDALLGTYFLGLGILLTPQIAAALPPSMAGVGSVLVRLDPFGPLGPLIGREDIGPAWRTGLIWLSFGIVGVGIAAWRLRPNCLKWLGGEPPRKRRARRWGRIPKVADRPMFWKEVYIEKGGSIAGFARWLGYLTILYLVLATSILGGQFVHALFWKGDQARADRMIGLLQQAVVEGSEIFALILILAVGLRASVAIASERERNTWDALLTSPLDGSNIVWGKLWGSVLGLRWLMVAMLFAWGVAFAVGSMTWWEFLTTIINTVAWSAYMAALGVRMSLTSATATSSMAKTIGATFGSWIGFYIGALLTVGILGFLYWVAWLAIIEAGMPIGGFPGWPMNPELAFFLMQLLMVVSATASLASETALRFDRLAGRMSSGGAGLAIDRMFHGGPLEPVLLDEVPSPP